MNRNISILMILICQVSMTCKRSEVPQFFRLTSVKVVPIQFKRIEGDCAKFEVSNQFESGSDVYAYVEFSLEYYHSDSVDELVINEPGYFGCADTVENVVLSFGSKDVPVPMYLGSGKLSEKFMIIDDAQMLPMQYSQCFEHYNSTTDTLSRVTLREALEGNKLTFNSLDREANNINFIGLLSAKPHEEMGFIKLNVLLSNGKIIKGVAPVNFGAED